MILHVSSPIPRVIKRNLFLKVLSGDPGLGIKEGSENLDLA